MRKVVFSMKQEKVSSCQYCFEGKCYANAAVSPEEYDCYQPQCRDCKSQTKKEA